MKRIRISAPTKETAHVADAVQPQHRCRIWLWVLLGIGVLSLVLISSPAGFRLRSLFGVVEETTGDRFVNERLKRLWTSGSIPRRQLVLNVLKRGDREDPTPLAQFESAVLMATTDPDGELRELALDLLMHRNHPELLQHVQKQLVDLDPALRLAGLRCLNATHPPRIDMVQPLLNDPDALVARAAACLISKWTGAEFGISTKPTNSWFTYDLAQTPPPDQMAVFRDAVHRWEGQTLRTRPQIVNDVAADRVTVSAPKLPAPEFSLETLAGKSVRLSEFRGKPVVLYFWHPAVAPSVADLEVLRELQASDATNTVILAVAGIRTSIKCEKCLLGGTHDHHHEELPPPEMSKVRADLRPVVERVRIPFHVPIDLDGTVGLPFGVYRYPVTVLIDANGNIQRRLVGCRTAETLRHMLKEDSMSTKTLVRK